MYTSGLQAHIALQPSAMYTKLNIASYTDGPSYVWTNDQIFWWLTISMHRTYTPTCLAGLSSGSSMYLTLNELQFMEAANTAEGLKFREAQINLESKCQRLDIVNLTLEPDTCQIWPCQKDNPYLVSESSFPRERNNLPNTGYGTKLKTKKPVSLLVIILLKPNPAFGRKFGDSRRLPLHGLKSWTKNNLSTRAFEPAEP